MVNEQKPKKRGPGKGRAQAAAERFNELRAEGKNFQQVSTVLEHEGHPGLAVAMPAPTATEALRMVQMTMGDMLERISQAESQMTRQAKDAVARAEDLARVTLKKSETLDDRMATISTRIDLLMQLLKALDPVRIDRAVQLLEGARQSYEALPLKETVRDSAAAIRAGERPPRRKLGVTIDGSLWAAVEEVQRRRRCTISDILDQALQLWVENERSS